MRKVCVPAETAETAVCAKWRPSESGEFMKWIQNFMKWIQAVQAVDCGEAVMCPSDPSLSWKTVFLAVGCAAGAQPSSGIALAKERDTSFLLRSHKVTHPSQASPHPMTYQSSMTEVKWSESRSVMSNSLQHHGLYNPWNSPGQNTGVGSCSLLQGIFPTQGSNPGLPHCRWILYQLSYQGSTKNLPNNH